MKIATVPFGEAIRDVSAGNRKIPQSGFHDSGSLAIVDQGRGLVAGYTDDAEAKVSQDPPVIVFGDHTRALKFVDFPFAMGADGVKVLRVVDGFDPRYVFHFLTSRELPSQGYARHFKFLKEIEIPRPPLAEQRRIAAILDHADALRAKRCQILAHLDSLTGSIFHDIFGVRDDACVRLDSLVSADDRLNYGVVQPGDNVPGGVPMVRVSDLSNGLIDRSDLKRIASKVESSYIRSRIRGNEILVSSVGSIGRVALAGEADRGSNVARAITRVPIDDPVLREYVAAYLTTPAPQNYFTRELRTVAQPTLNVGQLAATVVPMPPAELRKQFVERLRRVRTQVKAVQAASKADTKLFASLQARAFRGELR